MFIRMSDYRPTSASPWLIAGLVSASRTTLSALANGGKSTLASAIAHTTTTGEPFHEHELIGDPGPVYWIGTDGGWRDETFRRTQGWPQPARELLLIEQLPSSELTSDYVAGTLLPALLAIDPRLVIFDHLTGLVGTRDIDQPSGFNGAIEPYLPLIDRFPSLILAHASKSARDGRAAHTHAIQGWGRVNLELGGLAGDAEQTLRVVSNEAPTKEIRLRRGDAGYDITVPARLYEGRDLNLWKARAAAVIAVAESLGRPVTTREAVDALAVLDPTRDSKSHSSDLSRLAGKMKMLGHPSRGHYDAP